MGARISDQSLLFETHGKLAIPRVLERRPPHIIVEALCLCGNLWTGTLNRLRTGNTKSCGCHNLEAIRERNFKHGYSPKNRVSPVYTCWQNIKIRCYNPKSKDWPNYGGRGIKMCDEWKSSFTTFLRDMKEPPHENWEIDRINNDGDYTPSNCRWVPESIQHANQRRYLRRRGAKS